MPKSFKRPVSLLASVVVLSSLGGCAQIGQVADGVWGGTKSVAKFVSSPFRGKDDMRDAPAQDYAFAGDGVTVELYEQPVTPTYADTQYSGNPYQNSVVELYDLRTTTASYAAVSDPRDAAFVSLNGKGRQSDWNNCEMMHRGYMYADEMSGLMLDPKFEVCMRNKGYVLTSEVSGFSYAGDTVRAADSYLNRTDYPQGYTQSYP